MRMESSTWNLHLSWLEGFSTDEAQYNSSLVFLPLPTDFWSLVPWVIFIFDSALWHYSCKPFLPWEGQPGPAHAQKWLGTTHMYSTKYKLNAFPIQLPLGRIPQMPTPGPNDQRRGTTERNSSGRNSHQTQLWLKYIPLANLAKTQDHGITMLGFFPRPQKGQSNWGAMSLNFLCSREWASACCGGRLGGPGGPA